MATVVGLVLAFGSIYTALVLDGGHLSDLLHISPAILIMGGSTGAMLIGFAMADAKKLPKAIASTFKAHHEDLAGLTNALVSMAERARREGILALQEEVGKLSNPLLQRGLSLAIDGTDPEVVRQMMESAIEMEEKRQMVPSEMMEVAGGYAPTVGIVGTVMGLIHVLGNLSEPEKLGPMIAVAFLATLYGIGSSNLFFLPLAAKIKHNAHHNKIVGQMCITGVMGLQLGEAPRTLREKLEVFLEPGEKSAVKGEKDE